MDRAPELPKADSFASYSAHAGLVALRIALGLFSGMKWPRHDAFLAVRRILGQNERDFQFEEMPGVWQQARERVAAMEAAPPAGVGPLFSNIEFLAGHFGLSRLQGEILLLRVLARLYRPLRKVLEEAGDCDDLRLAQILSMGLARPVDDVRETLRRDSALFASGLVHLSVTVSDPIERLNPLPGLSGILTRPYDSFEELCGAFVQRAPPATLEARDFIHLNGKFELLVAYLARVCREKSKGRNVLLYGVPGTGKTELARLVAATAGLQIYVSEVSGEEGEPLGVKDRLYALVFLQRMVHSMKDTVALLDEVEDVFKPESGPDPDKRTVSAADSKGWTVRLLENNPTPTIWISNRVGHIDPAVLRRFDLVMEIPVPPLEARRQILGRAIGPDFAARPAIERILRDVAPAPALLSRAADVLSAVGGRPDADVVSDLRIILGGYLEVLGHRMEKEPVGPVTAFDPKYLNAEPRWERIAAEIEGGRAFRLLLSGPSGTGKTSFAQFLAAKLGEPLLTATVRDIVSEPGWTEHNLRKAFDRAERDGAILFLDQMDWLVWAPRDYRSPDEQRTLDQLYACLDSHGGRVICATTRAMGLEPGFVRRFSLRMRFDYLTRGQQQAFLGQLLSSDTDAAAIVEAIAGLSAIAAGDVVAALQGLDPDPKGIVASLTEGQRLRQGNAGTAIGFAS